MKKIFARTTEIAGSCFVFLAVLSFITLVSYNVNDLLNWIIFAGYAAMAYCLFDKKREMLLIGAASAVAGGLFVQFILFIINQIKYHAPFGSYSLTFVNELLLLLSFTGLALIAIATLSDKLNRHLDLFEKFWYIPTVLRTLALVLTFYIASQNRYFYFFQGLSIVIGGLIGIAAIFFATVWLLFPERLPDPEPKIPDGPEGYIKMVKHILLLFLTFGIWWLIWIYRTTKYLNLATNEEPRKPVTELLLCMFIPFYLVYWNYKSTLRIDTMLEQNGMGPKIGNVCIFWSIFAPFMVPVIMQDSINRLALEFDMGCNNLPESFYLFDSTNEIEQ